METYEKKYKEANDKIAARFGTNVAKEIFTDLYESEDEKIRKAIIKLVRQSSEVLDKQNQNNMIVWLENQKEYESTDFEYVWDRTDCGDLTSALDKYSEEAIINMCHAWYDKGIELERKSWLEKQGKQRDNLIDIDAMVLKYSNTREKETNGLPVNCQIRSYRQGINDTLNLSLNIEKQGYTKKDVDEIIKNAEDHAYFAGSENTREKLIDKACKWWEVELTYPSMTPEEFKWYKNKVRKFRKDMEDK